MLIANLEKVDLTGARQMVLVTLYCSKALGSRRQDSILGDREADNALRRIVFDFSTFQMARRDG